MTGPDRIWAWPWEVNPRMGQWFAEQQIVGEGTEYIRRDPAVLAALPEVQALIRQAVEAEREACANEADRIADKYWRPLIVTRSDSEAAVDEGKMDAAFEVAAAIRKRVED